MTPHATALRARTRTSAALRGAAVAIAIAAVALLAGCGGHDETAWAETGPGSVQDTMFSPAAGEIAVSPRAAAPAPGAGSGPADVTPVAAPGQTRAVIRTARLELVVDDSPSAVKQTATIAEQSGGYVSGSYLSRADDGTVSGSLTLRVPADQLDTVVEQLDALARAVPSRSVDEYDVTDQLTDLDARLANLRAYETELRELLGQVREDGGQVESLIVVADRLNQVRTEIDAAEGRRRQLAGQVELSTITVSIVQATATTPVATGWDLPAVIRDAVAALIAIGRTIVVAAVWAAIVILPIALTLAAARRAWRAWRRNRRGRRRAASENSSLS